MFCYCHIFIQAQRHIFWEEYNNSNSKTNLASFIWLIWLYLSMKMYILIRAALQMSRLILFFPVGFLSHIPINGADAGHCVVVTYSFSQQSVSDLPGKHGRVLAFVLCDFVNNFWCSDLWFGASNDSWLNAACLIIPACIKNIIKQFFNKIP